MFKENIMVVTAVWGLLAKRRNLSGRLWRTCFFVGFELANGKPSPSNTVFFPPDNCRRCCLHLSRVLLYCFKLFLVLFMYCDFFLYSCLFSFYFYYLLAPSFSNEGTHGPTVVYRGLHETTKTDLKHLSRGFILKIWEDIIVLWLRARALLSIS